MRRSTYGRSSLALGTVVVIRSWANRPMSKLRLSDVRWEALRPSLRPRFRWRIGAPRWVSRFHGHRCGALARPLGAKKLEIRVSKSESDRLRISILGFAALAALRDPHAECQPVLGQLALHFLERRLAEVPHLEQFVLG